MPRSKQLPSVNWRKKNTHPESWELCVIEHIQRTIAWESSLLDSAKGLFQTDQGSQDVQQFLLGEKTQKYSEVS